MGSPRKLQKQQLLLYLTPPPSPSTTSSPGRWESLTVLLLTLSKHLSLPPPPNIIQSTLIVKQGPICFTSHIYDQVFWLNCTLKKKQGDHSVLQDFGVRCALWQPDFYFLWSPLFLIFSASGYTFADSCAHLKIRYTTVSEYRFRDCVIHLLYV